MYFDSYKKELQEAASQGTDELITKIEDFSRVLYENLDSVDQAEVAGTLKEVVDSIQNRKSQSVLLNQTVLMLNDVFDAFQPAERILQD